MRYLALSSAAVVVMLLASVNTFTAFAQNVNPAGPALIMEPTKVKPGDRAVFIIAGYLAHAQVNVQIIGYGAFLPITTDELGHAYVPFTVPNMLSGNYNLQVSDDSGRTAIASFTVNPTYNTPSPQYGLADFSHFIIPSYYYSSTTIKSNLILQATNVFSVPVTIGMLAYDGTTQSTLVSGISLQPGESYVFSGKSYGSPTNPVTMTYTLYAATTTGSLLSDEIKVIQLAGFPVSGTSSQYPETFNTLGSVGSYVTYPTPPTGTICPTGYHLDLNTGKCLNNVTGACLGCINPLSSIQLTERSGLTTGIAGSTTFNFVATAKNSTSQPIPNEGKLYEFVNSVKTANATVGSDGTAIFPTIFTSPGTYTIEVANNTNDVSPVKSNTLSISVTTTGSGGGGTSIDFNALFLGLPLWLWLLIIIIIIAVIAVLSRGKNKKVRISRRRH